MYKDQHRIYQHALLAEVIRDSASDLPRRVYLSTVDQGMVELLCERYVVLAPPPWWINNICEVYLHWALTSGNGSLVNSGMETDRASVQLSDESSQACASLSS